MTVFKDDNDAINYAVRKLYWDILYRNASSGEVAGWASQWKAYGGDFVLRAFTASAEGFAVRDAIRKHVGLYAMQQTAPAANVRAAIRKNFLPSAMSPDAVPAKKSTAKKSTAKKSTAKKSTAKKSTAKRG
jgi:hypothetical protein